MEYERHSFPQPLYGGVNTLRIGDTLIDTGHVAPISRDALRESLSEELEGIERVVHTHPHIDHLGGSETIGGLAELPHTVPAGSVEILYNYSDHLQRGRKEMMRLLGGFTEEEKSWADFFPDIEYTEERINVTRELTDGELVEFGSESFEVISTPGHADPHLAFWHEESKTLLSGDLVDPDGRFQYGPLLGDVGEYKSSLRRIARLDPDVLVPMHGPRMTEPLERIEEALEDAERTETRILGFTEEHAPFYARDFVTEELGVTGDREPLLTLVIDEYVQHLEERNLLRREVTEDGIRVQ